MGIFSTLYACPSTDFLNSDSVLATYFNMGKTSLSRGRKATRDLTVTSLFLTLLTIC